MFLGLVLFGVGASTALEPEDNYSSSAFAQSETETPDSQPDESIFSAGALTCLNMGDVESKSGTTFIKGKDIQDEEPVVAY